jgi:hypothetical protein
MPKVSKEEISWYTVIRGHRLKMDKIAHQLQDKGCNQYQHMKDLIKCKPCQEPEAREENCLFKDFRAFHCHETGLRFGYFFPDAIQQRSPLSHSSKRFNQNKPYDPEDRTYLKSKLRDILKETFAQDQPPIHHRAKSQQQSLLRKGFEGYRHVCDICLTSIFNYHYFCPACAIDICLHCYSRWRHVKKDPNKSMCHKGLNHSPQMFRLSQKYSKEDISVVREELDDLEDKDIDVIGDEPDAPMDDEANTQKPDPSLLPLTPDSDDQRAGYIEKEECGPVIMIKESGYARSLSLDNNTDNDKDAGSPSLPADVTDNNKSDNNNSNNIASAKDKDVPINQNKYDHLDGVTMTEPTDRSLPTTIANAATMTTKIFQEIWQDKNPLLVENCLDNSTVSWNPKYFGEKYGNQEIEVIDCKDNSKHISTAKEFFDSYESEEKLAAYCDKLSTSNVIKIKVKHCIIIIIIIMTIEC